MYMYVYSLAGDNKLDFKKRQKKKKKRSPSPPTGVNPPSHRACPSVSVYCTVDYYVTVSVAARAGVACSEPKRKLQPPSSRNAQPLSHAPSPCFAFKFSNHTLVSTQSISFLQQNKDSPLIAPLSSWLKTHGSPKTVGRRHK